MRAPLGALTGVALWSVACGGFFDDIVLDGPDAEPRLGAVAGGSLPTGVQDAHLHETTSIDWIFNGEARAPRSEAEAWFAALKLTCDRDTVEEPGPVPSVRPILGDLDEWKAPYDAEWRTKTCKGSTFSGPHFQVSITDQGDPAWIAVEAMRL